MKKITAILTVMLLTATLLTACGCDHEYVSRITKEATYESAGTIMYYCSNCGDMYEETIPQLEKHFVSTDILDEALSNTKYTAGPFTITIGRLVNKAMPDYEITYLTGEEAISKGYISRNKIDSSVNIDNLYCGIISGDTMINPDVPYMTEYEERAVVVWMIFDENDNLLNSGATLCQNLQTCAILIMSR